MFYRVLTLLCVLFAFVPQAFAVCEAIDVENHQAGGWEYDEFYEAGTSNPAEVTMTISILQPGTAVQYFDGSSWIPTSGGTVEGTKARFSIGGSLSITFDYGEECDDEIIQHTDS